MTQRYRDPTRFLVAADRWWLTTLRPWLLRAEDAVWSVVSWLLQRRHR